MKSYLLRGPSARLCMGLAYALSVWDTVSSLKGEAKKDKGMAFLPAAAWQETPLQYQGPRELATPSSWNGLERDNPYLPDQHVWPVPGNEDFKKEKEGVVLSATGSVLKGEERKEKWVEVLGTTELPARSVDLSALNLTELVNGMLTRVLKADSKKFFSLLTITSYSSFAFHKVSVAVYNISNPKTVDPARFPTRHCYCLNNRTNDLSDFTALLVDIVGNSSSYLTEIFKSTSILSVSQTNESDCVFICVMAGRSGRSLSDYWEMVEKPPVVSYTFTSSVAGASAAATRETARTSRFTTQSQQTLMSSSPAPWSTQGASALRTFWKETSTALEEEVTWNTESFAELPVGGTITQRSVSQTLWTSATRRLTDDKQTWASTPSVPRAQIMDDNRPEQQLWESRSSTPASTALLQQRTSTSDLLHPDETPILPDSPAQPSTASGTVTPGTQTPSPTKAPAPRDPQAGDSSAKWPLTPEEEPVLVSALHQVSRCPQPLLKEGTVTAAPLPPAIPKLNPCLLELCRFFQQCLCVGQRRDSSVETMRYCLDYYSWFLKNAALICQRVKRVSHSRTLKQKCLENVCKAV